MPNISDLENNTNEISFISYPESELEALRVTVLELKSVVEMLLGTSGDVTNRAITVKDLVTLGLLEG